MKQQNKREILKDKVVALVRNFVETEGGITQIDLLVLFGAPASIYSEVATALAEFPVTFTAPRP